MRTFKNASRARKPINLLTYQWDVEARARESNFLCLPSSIQNDNKVKNCEEINFRQFLGCKQFKGDFGCY